MQVAPLHLRWGWRHAGSAQGEVWFTPAPEVVAWRAWPRWPMRNFLTSKDPLTSGHFQPVPQVLAELSLFWAFQNVLPISLPAAHVGV